MAGKKTGNEGRYMRRKITAVAMALLLVGTAACGNQTETKEQVTPTASVVEEQGVTGQTGSLKGGQNTTNASESLVKLDTLVSADGEVDIQELETLAAQASVEQATTITLAGNKVQIDGKGCEAENGTVRITEAGTYMVSGKLENGSIVVDADKNSMVYLILNGVEITNPNGAAIYGKKAEKLVITLAEGTTNVLTDSEEYVFEEGEDEPDATLFAKQDLLITGKGELIVQAKYGDAIKGKDALYLFDGSYKITAEDEGITGKDLLYIQNGTYVINAVGDALKASNDTDTTLGNLVIENGTFTISSEDDGIHAENGLVISGGDITITKSYEGIEGAFINIYGGNISIVSSDDGINAAGGSSDTTQAMFGFGMSNSNYEMNFHGGTIYVDAAGDGLDANGKISMDGGTLVVYGTESGANGALDYDTGFAVNGGTLLVTGSSAMAQSPDTSSTQNTISAVFSSVQNAGSEVAVTAADGTELCKITIPKKFQQFVYSSADVKTGETYTLSVNGEAQLEGAVESVITYFGNAGFGGMGGFGGFGGFGGGGRNNGGGKNKGGFNGELPSGEIPSGGFNGELPNGEIPSGGFNGELPNGGFNGELLDGFMGGNRGGRPGEITGTGETEESDTDE